ISSGLMLVERCFNIHLRFFKARTIAFQPTSLTEQPLVHTRSCFGRLLYKFVNIHTHLFASPFCDNPPCSTGRPFTNSADNLAGCASCEHSQCEFSLDISSWRSSLSSICRRSAVAKASGRFFSPNSAKTPQNHSALRGNN